MLAAGSEFAGFRIRSALGEGATCTVYLAERPSGGSCALKVLDGPAADDPTYVERFAREARVTAALEHPSILRVFASGQSEDGTAFLAMEYIDGTDLRARIASGRLAPATILCILRQIAGALDLAHAHAYIHRDVKPGNILVANSGWPRPRAYLTDFGYTKSLVEDVPPLTAAGLFIGTTGYTAPEEVTAQPRDHRADIYSLTCVLYECFTGRPPLIQASELRSLQAHLVERRPRVTDLRPDLPAALDAVIGRGMAIDPRERFDSCTALLTATAEALGRRLTVHLRLDRVTGELDVELPGGRHARVSSRSAPRGKAGP